MHLTDTDILTIADGETLGARNIAVRDHVNACEACATAVVRESRARAWESRLLQAVDGPVPNVPFRAIAARARRSRAVRRRRVIVAGIAWALAAGAAAAMVGPPLFRLATRVPGHAAGSGAAPPAPLVRAPAVSATQEGIAFRPGSDVTVALQHPEPAGTMRVRIVPGPSVRLTHHGGAAEYSLTPDGVRIDNAGSTASYDLELPAAVAQATVRVGVRVVFRKMGSEVVTSAPRDSSGAYVIILSLDTIRHRRKS